MSSSDRELHRIRQSLERELSITEERLEAIRASLQALAGQRIVAKPLREPKKVGRPKGSRDRHRATPLRDISAIAPAVREILSHGPLSSRGLHKALQRAGHHITIHQVKHLVSRMKGLKRQGWTKSAVISLRRREPGVSPPPRKPALARPVERTYVHTLNENPSPQETEALVLKLLTNSRELTGGEIFEALAKQGHIVKSSMKEHPRNTLYIRLRKMRGIVGLKRDNHIYWRLKPKGYRPINEAHGDLKKLRKEIESKDEQPQASPTIPSALN